MWICFLHVLIAIHLPCHFIILTFHSFYICPSILLKCPLQMKERERRKKGIFNVKSSPCNNFISWKRFCCLLAMRERIHIRISRRWKENERSELKFYAFIFFFRSCSQVREEKKNNCNEALIYIRNLFHAQKYILYYIGKEEKK